MNWDLVFGGEDPVIDNIKSEEYNVPHWVKHVEDLAESFNQKVVHKNVLFPMGCDFTYQYADATFKSMDKLIKAVNAKSDKVKIFYSTPSCYTKAILDSKKKFTAKNDDYFPYGSDGHTYWTGYFSSRPTLKRFERVGNNILQACKQIDVLAGNKGAYEEQISDLRDIMGVMQHHDAVSGKFEIFNELA